MTQLTLFSDLTASPVPVSPSISSSSGQSVAPKDCSSAAADAPRATESKSGEQDTLLKLATLIRDGRAQMEAQSRVRSRPIQSIGDLAQSVLLRHDLVARRRAAASASNHSADRVCEEVASTVAASSAAATRVPVVGLAQTPAQVHVAS
ncbi:hypothetical protein FHS27_003626 [Rhodopirellula rubra]|uniref:Uncharacterized protein n=1 Tax=Aporhodopirellula rubra TaxID=980271 RepID=A0A7W5E109_9BACT|nr:hypothetical protein [Aporhodopirellula rubra]MBB3207799.1 hypothetical protein [Aporhodopirellula rubra]